MAWFRWRRQGAQPYGAVTEEERIARYVYLLNTLPASVIEKAHASAFKEFSPEKRRAMFEELRPFMSEAERQQAPQPALLASVMGRVSAARRASGGVDDAEAESGETDRPAAADIRRANWPLQDTSLMTSLAVYFMASHAVTSYYTIGAGALMLSSEPAWVGDLGDTGSAGAGSFDGGGGFGGGFDGGGGFDAGGFGGFDGGGGFG